MFFLHRKMSAASLLLSVCVAISVSGCGDAFDKLMGKKTKTSEADNYEKSDVVFHLGYASGSTNLTGDSFSLASVSAFTVDITSCASGYSVSGATAASSTTTVKLYAHDRGCVAELTDFTYNGKTYVKQGGGNLSSGVANFENQLDANDILVVSVVTPLPDPLTDGATASFAFHEISKGSDKAIANYSYTDTIEVKGVEAPNFEIHDIRINSIDATTGEATFEIITNCKVAMTLSGSDRICQSPTSDDQMIKDMKVKLIYNDSGTYTANTMTYAQAQAAMSAGTTALTNASYDTSHANGGFTVAVSGAGQLYTHKDMFFIIAYTDATYGESYRYFRVTIGDPQ